MKPLAAPESPPPVPSPAAAEPSTPSPAPGARGPVARRLRHQRVRSYQVLRTAHLERARDFRPASVLYAEQRYDFDADLAGTLDLHRCGPWALVRLLLANPVAALEINEPLQLSGLPRAALAVAAVRLGDRRRGVRSRVAAYAIENRDPFTSRPRRLRSRLRRAGEAVLCRVVTGQLDRIAYGTPGAAQLYTDRLSRSLRRTTGRVFPAVPAPCDCPPAPRESETVLYLAALHRRKGISELLQAWPRVLQERPAARLVVVGKGELAETVREAAAVPSSRIELVLDPPRADIHRLLRQAAVLVLFSQPSPTWREQVGLPIVEGLAHGCSVVASSQTGLAQWLREAGHTVLDPSASAADLGRGVAAALAAARSPASVLDQLPGHDGRRAADDWLLHDDVVDRGAVAPGWRSPRKPNRTWRGSPR